MRFHIDQVKEFMQGTRLGNDQLKYEVHSRHGRVL